MTPLLLLPGMMCDARLFTPQIAHFGGRRALHIAPISQADNIQAIAQHILAHAPPLFALAGLSMGGIVAMEITRQAPKRVERLALLDTNPLAEAPDIAARRDVQIQTALAGGLRNIIRDEMKPHYLADTPARDHILDLCMQMALDLGPEIFIRQSRALQNRPDQSETLRNYRGKSLVLMGQEDRLCPLARHQLLHELLPDSEFTIIKEAGHLPVLEAPEKTNAALTRWLLADQG